MEEEEVGNGGGGMRRYRREMMMMRRSPEKLASRALGSAASTLAEQQSNGKSTSKSRMVKPTFRKVQVVYYLSKNGQLEHPHFMEVTHLLHQHLRLRDVIERLTLLRGKGMPSLYSWSCKRSYKNGYVWNDLGENDIICATDGAEYVLKGSELIEGCTEKLQQVQLGGRMQEPLQDPSIFHSKRKHSASKRQLELHEVDYNNYEDEEANVKECEESSLNYAIDDHTPSRCSRGVSTDEAEFLPPPESTRNKNPTTELTLEHDSSPPSTTSCESNNNSKRFEDGDPVVTESVLSRNSVFLQFIACGGGSVGFKGKDGGGSGCLPVAGKQQRVQSQPPCNMGPVLVAGRKSTSSLHKGVLCKTAEAAKEVVVGDDHDHDHDHDGGDEISCMSENPRFGNLQAEEKEYFSGSIVEAMAEGRGQVEPSLKKSSSYNEERSAKGGLEATAVEAEEELKKERSVLTLGKCIPRMMTSSSNTTSKPSKK